MKLSVLYFTYSILSVLSTDRMYTISNDLSCESCLNINSLPDSFSQVDRVHLQINAGRHTLTKSGSLVFDHVLEVHVIGTPDAAEIVCANNSGIMFSSVGNVVIANVSLLYCGVSSIHGVSAVLLHLVSDFTLDNVGVYNSTASGIVISEVYGFAQIMNSVISGSPITNVVCSWGNSHSKNATSFVFTVENSVIEHGGRELHLSCNNETADRSGGMNIVVDEIETNATVRINNVTFYKNSGCTGGNINIVVSKSKWCPSTHNLVDIIIADSLISHGSARIGAGLAFSGVYAHCHGSACCDNVEIANTAITDNHATDGGGGIAVWIDESYHSINVCFYHLTLQANTVSRPSVSHSKFSFTGGGLDFHFLRDGLYCRNAPVLVIDRCAFDANLAHSGAGLYITANYAGRLLHSGNCTEPLVILNYSDFQGNEADFGAGAMLSFSASHTGIIHMVSVLSSRFENNTATSQASGMLIMTLLDDSSFRITLDNLSFTSNRIFNQGTHRDGFPATLSLLSLPRLSMSNCTFYQNEGSAIGAVSSRILVSGLTKFSGNRATFGSGLNLVSSHLELTDSSITTFRANRADVGGAIYAINVPQASCFYLLSGDTSNRSKGFQFIDNSARVGGDVVYERTRSECTLIKPGLQTSNFLSISEVSNQPIRSLIGSDPKRVCVCQGNDTYDCQFSSFSFSVIRGSPLVVSVMLTDDNGFTTPGYISIIGTMQEIIHSEWIGGYSCSNITIPYSTNEASAHFRLFPTSYHHSSTGNAVDLFLSFHPCPSGFEISGDGTECECPLFSDAVDLLLCSAVPEFTFTRLPSLWIGHEEDGTTRIFHSCPFNYCKPGKIIWHDLSNSSYSLCAPGRLGILCGECSGSLSVALGRGDCKHCSNNSTTLVLAFCVLGILLLVAITLLSLTITTGIVNGVIFYAAFLHLNRTSIFPTYHNGNLFVIFTSWLNLDFGFNVCFYDGLTSHAKVWLQFIFPVYLFAIEILVIVSSYRFSKLARVTGARNRVKIMSTVFLLGYMKLLRAVLSVFPYAKVQSLYNSSDVKTVWLYDGSIEYNSEHHTPLLVTAVLFLAVISLPYNFSLLFVQVLQRLPLPCKIRWEGAADAHVGPFKPKFRFWLGLLLLSYTFLVLLYNFTGGEKGINLTALMIICSLLLLLNVFFGGVYKNKILNVSESFFFFNLAILSALYLQMSYSKLGNSKAALYCLVSIAFALILIILVYHLCTSITSKEDNVCFNWKTPKVFTTRDNYQVLNDEQSFETNYTNASTVIDKASEEETRFDSDGNIEVVPINWLPTNYPEPLYREHPDLLKSEKEGDSHTQSDSSEKSIPQLNKVESSYLVVNKREEEASLVRNPNNTLRIQRLSVDGSGDTVYVIEDNAVEDYTKGGISEDVHNSNSLKQTNDLKVHDTTKETNKVSRVSSPSMYQQRSALQIRRVSLSRRSRKRPPNKKNSTPMQPKRPQSGTSCCKCDPSLFLQSKIQTFKVDRSGGKHSISSHDVTLTIPPLAIREGHGHTSLDIEVGILLNGPFVFPPGIRPISPILWICSRNDALLCKPIEIVLPHFVGRLEENEPKLLGMQFMKASHYAPTLPDGTRRYIFDSIGSNSTSFTSHLGKLKTLHFCFLCIAAPESRALYERASYCLTRLDPVVWNLSRQRQEIYFIVSYFMKTCLKCIKDQASSNQQKIESQNCFEFSNQNNTVPKLSVKVKNSIPGPKWTLVFENCRQVMKFGPFHIVPTEAITTLFCVVKQILASEVDFWAIHDQGRDLEYMTLNRMYPPRFKLVISGKNATEPTIAQIIFSGSLNDLDTDILLEPDDDCRSLCSSIDSGSYRTPRGTAIPVHGISLDDWEILKTTEPHFPLLQRYICRVSVKWKLIGVQLEIGQNVLVGIELTGHDLTTLTTEVLMTWRRNVRLPFTWATIIDVLAGDVISENALAAEIATDILRSLASY